MNILKSTINLFIFPLEPSIYESEETEQIGSKELLRQRIDERMSLKGLNWTSANHKEFEKLVHLNRLYTKAKGR